LGKLFRLDSQAAKRQRIPRLLARDPFSQRRPGFRRRMAARAPEAWRGDRFGACGNGLKHLVFVTRLPNCFLRPPSRSGYCPELPFF